MPPLIDLTGRTFGKLTVIGRAHRPGPKVRWTCRCVCGAVVTPPGDHLKRGSVKSCGCHLVEWARQKQLRHGHAGRNKDSSARSQEYQVWLGIKRRCFKVNHPHFKYYGGRGITMCPEWRDSFEAFLRDVGPAPSPAHSLDRVDNDRDYCPANCRWATRTEQMNNTSRNRYLTVNGRTLTCAEWAREAGLKHHTVTSRLYSGWSPADAVSIPAVAGQKRKTKA